MEPLLAELRAVRATLASLVGAQLPHALSYERAAAELSISVPQLRKLIRRGLIATVLIGRRPKVPASEVVRLCRVEAQKALKPAPLVQLSKRGDGKSEAEKIRARLRRRVH